MQPFHLKPATNLLTCVIACHASVVSAITISHMHGNSQLSLTTCNSKISQSINIRFQQSSESQTRSQSVT